MKVKVVEPKVQFKPITLSITFESEDELTGAEGFVKRYDQCAKNNTGNYMSVDEFNTAVRDSLATNGYPFAPKEK